MAAPPTAPAPDGTVGGSGEAVAGCCRESDDAPPSKGLNLLGQQLPLPVAVAQPAEGSTAPALDGAVGGDGDAAVASRRHSDDAPPSKGLDVRWQQLLLLVAVAQTAAPSKAPAPDGSDPGEGEAVRGARRHSHGALTQQRESGRRCQSRHALTVTEEFTKSTALSRTTRAAPRRRCRCNGRGARRKTKRRQGENQGCQRGKARRGLTALGRKKLKRSDRDSNAGSADLRSAALPLGHQTVFMRGVEASAIWSFIKGE